MTNRRALLTGIGAALLVASPAIVRASSLMPVRTIRSEVMWDNGMIRMIVSGVDAYGLPFSEQFFRSLEDAYNYITCPVGVELNSKSVLHLACEWPARIGG